jgi:hypothetical protein
MRSAILLSRFLHDFHTRRRPGSHGEINVSNGLTVAISSAYPYVGPGFAVSVWAVPLSMRPHFWNPV